MDVNSFLKLPIFGILRGVTKEQLPLIDIIMRETHLHTIEITMNTDKAPALIKEINRLSQGNYTVGAGTVLNTIQMEEALNAGASFIVSPHLVTDVVQHCAKEGIPVFPGAFTPTEIYTAWRAGASMVKVFPASVLGPKYFKEIKGPYDDIPLLACGGVNQDSIAAFFKNGASAVSFGGSVFKQKWLNEKDLFRIIIGINSLISSAKVELNSRLVK